MTLLDREVVPPSVSTKGVLYSVFLLLLVVSLFFIPEIVRFQESVTKGKKPQRKTAQTNQINLDDILPSTGKSSSLDKILSMVTGGGGSKEQISLDSLSLEAPGNIPSTAETGKGRPLKEIQDKVMLEKTFSGSGGVTWEQLNSAPVKKAFREAQASASKILKGLSGRQNTVRFALINYINGLAWITRGDRKLMSAEEAMAYIEQLDINVTQAMLNSEIEAGDFESWKRISFGPLTVNSRAAAFKLGTRVSFNPRLTLSSVEIRRTPDYVMKNDGTYRQRTAKSSLKMSGFVLGKDVKKVVIYHDEMRVADLRVTQRTNEDGMRPFRWRYRTAEGLFSFKAYSKDGDVVEKNYVFLPKVYGRFAQNGDGYYLLPFGPGDSDLVSMRNLDTRLDRFFRVKYRGGSAEDQNRSFDTF